MARLFPLLRVCRRGGRHLTSATQGFEEIIASVDRDRIGQSMHDLIRRLFPINRSLTGDGVRETLRILKEFLPLVVTEVPTGTACFDWVVPDEWNVRDAYVKDATGRRVIDWRKHTLHLLGYSVPIHTTLSLEELRPHLYTLPAQPDAIPYLTSYYERRWGFCLTENQLRALAPGQYEVNIDSSLEPGSLSLADVVLPGASDREVLISTYVCHPSMANNELSGPAVTVWLYRLLATLPVRRYTYRFVFTPETLGTLAYLARQGEHLRRHLIAGYVVTCVGDPGPYTFKRSRRGDTIADRAGEHALRHYAPRRSTTVHDYSPIGSDERQYCSPGFDLPVASLTRSMYVSYPEYHTSLDDLDFVTADALADSLRAYLRILQVLERDGRYRNLSPYGEPQLGRRGLYPTLGSQKDTNTDQQIAALLWVLSYADGRNTLLDIAERADLPLPMLASAADQLLAAGLLAAE